MIRTSSAALLALAMMAGPLAAQPPAPAVSPYTQEQLFDQFRGMWENTNRISIEKFETVTEPLTPEYQAKRDLQIKLRAEGKQVVTSDAQCIPAGMPRMMLNANFEVLVRPDSLGLVTAGGGIQIRNIWTDGRKHTPEDDLFDSFSGESIGHWEGDTLVVDTTGLRPSNEFLYGVEGNKMTVTERFHKTGPDNLQIDTTVNDPVVFTTPWKYTTTFRRNLTHQINEQNYCVAALDREVDKNGKEIFDLTPPVMAKKK
jgi:hypothetical protein